MRRANFMKLQLSGMFLVVPLVIGCAPLRWQPSPILDNEQRLNGGQLVGPVTIRPAFRGRVQALTPHEYHARHSLEALRARRAELRGRASDLTRVVEVRSRGDEPNSRERATMRHEFGREDAAYPECSYRLGRLRSELEKVEHRIWKLESDEGGGGGDC